VSLGRRLACRLASRSPGRRATALHVEQLAQPSLDVGRRAVVDRLYPDLVAGRADVDLLYDLHHAFDVGARVRDDDEEVAGGVYGDVRILGLQVTKERRDLFGAHMAEPVDSRHVAILRRSALRPAGVERRVVPGDAAGLHDLEEPTMRDDREPVAVENRQEGLVCLRHRDLLRREDGCLDRADLAPEDEALACELADHADQLRKIRVLEGQRDLVCVALRGEVHARLELRKASGARVPRLDPAGRRSRGRRSGSLGAGRP